MFASSSYGLPNLTTPPPSAIPDPKQSPRKPSSLSIRNDAAPEPSSESEPEHRKLKGSSQLKRWSRARTIRSGRKLDRPAERAAMVVDVIPPVRSAEATSREFGSTAVVGPEEATGVEVKSIYMLSDGTGWTAEDTVNAALGQFDHCLVDRGCPVNTHLFSGVEDVEQLMEIIKQAAKEGAMILYTLADPAMAESTKQACRIWGIPATDILSPITEAIASHLGVSPSGLPRGAPGTMSHLTEDYFRRIEAIEFTIKHDDGALPENLQKADIVLVGVSRTGKTPLSTYLAHKGYKVANVPLVMGIDLPKTLFEVDQEKVFALTINPNVLRTIRRSRAKTLGFSDEMRSNYAEMDHVRRELDYASKIFAQNPAWPVIEVTGKAIEETAAVMLKLYYDRKNKCSMSRISKRY